MRAHRATGLIFGLFGLAHLHLLASILLGFGTEPAVLVVGHALALVLAVSGGVGALMSRSSTWKFVLAYGGVVSTMILSLGPALELGPRVWWQLVPAAAIVMAVAGLSARHLRRTIVAPA